MSCDRSLLKLKDVQDNDLAILSQKTVPMLVGPTGCEHAVEVPATFRVVEVRDNMFTLENWFERILVFNLGLSGCSMAKDGRKVPIWLERNSCVTAGIETWIRGGGNSCHG